MSNHFDLIQKSRKGKFKVYIGMSAGVGKLQDVTGSTYLVEKWYRCKDWLIETHNGKKHMNY
jgi:two-component system sensor histidine kinase KdpD